MPEVPGPALTWARVPDALEMGSVWQSRSAGEAQAWKPTDWLEVRVLQAAESALILGD